MLDLIIRNATVVDGSGSPGVPADVAVAGGRIRAVGRVQDAQAERTIDARGRVVCPGFIDMHAHSEIALLVNPRQESKVLQGVTTEVLGQDGLSYAPASGETLAALRKNLAALNGDSEAVSWDWTGVGDFLSRFDGKVAVNVCYLAPHGAVRLLVVGPENRAATEAELERMSALVAEGMSEGAVGFSTGLTYPPCAFADTRELEACCQAAAASGGYFAPHLRGYGARFFEAIEETIAVGRRSSIPVHLTHLHCSFPVNRHRAPELLARLDQARADGLDVTLDSYPYTAGATFLAGLFPSWAHSSGPEAFLARIADPATRETLRREMEEQGGDGYSHVPIDWQQIAIGGVRSSRNRWTVGRRVAELAGERRKRPFDLVCELLAEEHLDVTCLAFFGYEANVQAIMKHPRHMAGSDGLLTGARPHPRAYGTFARYLGRYVRELRVLTLEECVRKMTSLPAARLGLYDRGLVREGYAADLVVFDPEAIEDTATYEDPRRHPRGIDCVLVNGRIAMEHGRHTGILVGRVLKG